VKRLWRDFVGVTIWLMSSEWARCESRLTLECLTGAVYPRVWRFSDNSPLILGLRIAIPVVLGLTVGQGLTFAQNVALGIPIGMALGSVKLFLG
jgi:hypothetical protein